MSENIEKNLLSKRNSSNSEVNRSSPNLNTKSDCDVDDIHRVPKVGDDISQSISKSQQTISTSISMQDNQVHNGNIDYSLKVIQSEHVIAEASLSASFKQLSRRESSLENLAEDHMNVQVNTSASDIVVTYFVQKTDINDSMRDFTRKAETSSRFRRTIHSLFSCCSTKTRRSPFIEKTDCNIDSGTESENDKCNNPILSHRPVEKEHTSLNCLRLRKFFDLLDETDGSVKRVQQTRQTLPSVPYRDGDKNDSPGRKNGDNIQSENGGANLTYSDHDFPTVIPESESLLSVAPFYTSRPVLLGPIKAADQGKKCFIIDLDETLVHSSFKMVDKADFKVGVDIEGTVHTVYVLKRPYVDIFLQKMGRIFECVLFTASLAKYADPVTDFLDKWRVFRWRLFRESCVFHRGNYVKDLGMLGRLTDQIVILDNSPASYMFHPDSAVQITSWFDDPKDTALLDLIPYFEQLAQAPSVPPFLSSMKPPQRATVPVSVMIPLPNSLQAPSVTQNKFLGQSSSPITSVVSVPVTEDISSLNQLLIHTSSNVIQLPFSRSPSPHLRSFTKSLSSLPTYDSPMKSNFSRSLGTLGLINKEQPLFVKTFSIINQMRLSKSVSDLPKQLILQERPTTASTVQCISASSPIIMFQPSLHKDKIQNFLSPPCFTPSIILAHSAPSTPTPLSQNNTPPKMSASHLYSKLSSLQSTSDDSY